MRKRSETRWPEDTSQILVCEQWVERVRELPDFRWAKVLEARRKIREHLYDRDPPLEVILPRLAEEVGRLLRTGPLQYSP